MPQPVFTKIKPKNPIVEPAVPQKTFTDMWIKNLEIRAGNPNEPVRLHATFAPSREIVEVGKPTVIELKQGSDIRIEVENLFGEAATNAEIAAAMEAVFVALKAKGVEEGKFAV